MAKKKTVSIKKEKNKAEALKFLKKYRILLAVMFAILVAAVILSLRGETAYSNIADSFRAVPATIGESAGYPYEGDRLNLKKVTLIGDKPLLINSDGIEILSQDADSLYELHLNWPDTKVISNNGRAFVYSNTKEKAYLLSRTKKLAEFNEEGSLVTGTVGKNGSVALSYTTKNVQNTVKVYDNRQKNQFTWECAEDYVSSLALSNNGKKVAVAAVDVDSAELYTRLILFKTGKQAPVFEINIPGTTIIKLVYTSHGKIIAVGDNKTIILNGRGETVGEIPYSGDALFAVKSDSDGNVLLCYKEFGGSVIKVRTITASGNTKKEFDIDFTPDSVDMRGTKVAFALDNEVRLYSSSGSEKGTYPCESNISTVLITGVGIYTLENGTLCKH